MEIKLYHKTYTGNVSIIPEGFFVDISGTRDKLYFTVSDLNQIQSMFEGVIYRYEIECRLIKQCPYAYPRWKINLNSGIGMLGLLIMVVASILFEFHIGTLVIFLFVLGIGMMIYGISDIGLPLKPLGEKLNKLNEE